jgi:hypothetical protein
MKNSETLVRSWMRIWIAACWWELGRGTSGVGFWHMAVPVGSRCLWVSGMFRAWTELKRNTTSTSAVKKTKKTIIMISLGEGGSRLDGDCGEAQILGMIADVDLISWNT